jgi:hypothetical protein
LTSPRMVGRPPFFPWTTGQAFSGWDNSAKTGRGQDAEGGYLNRQAGNLSGPVPACQC